jgi:hypothetical protein
MAHELKYARARSRPHISHPTANTGRRVPPVGTPTTVHTLSSSRRKQATAVGSSLLAGAPPRHAEVPLLYLLSPLRSRQP